MAGREIGQPDGWEGVLLFGVRNDSIDRGRRSRSGVFGRVVIAT